MPSPAVSNGLIRYVWETRLRYVLTPLLVALIPATAAVAKPAKQVKTPGILYAIDAKDAVITSSGGSFRVSMPASTAVMWFTDPPARRAGSVRVTELAGIWKASGFVADPPNAALDTKDKGAQRTSVVEMTNPVIANGRVSFAIRQVRNAKEASRKDTHTLIAGRFARALPPSARR